MEGRAWQTKNQGGKGYKEARKQKGGGVKQDVLKPFPKRKRIDGCLRPGHRGEGGEGLFSSSAFSYLLKQACA